MKNKSSVIVRSYKGSQAKANKAFQKEATLLAKQGYVPTAQNWVQRQHGAADFLVALLLCFLLIGIIILVYMLLVKPSDGVLTVTFELRNNPSTTQGSDYSADTKICPKCAETIKEAAVVCRYCNHHF